MIVTRISSRGHGLNVGAPQSKTKIGDHDGGGCALDGNDVVQIEHPPKQFVVSVASNDRRRCERKASHELAERGDALTL